VTLTKIDRAPVIHPADGGTARHPAKSPTTSPPRRGGRGNRTHGADGVKEHYV